MGKGQRPVRKIRLPIIDPGLELNVWRSNEKFLSSLPEWYQKVRMYNFTMHKRVRDKKTGEFFYVKGFSSLELLCLIPLIFLALVWAIRQYEGADDVPELYRAPVSGDLVSDDTLDDTF